jgi:hypothetical protein
MKFITFIINLFSKRKSYSALFSKALAEAIKETIEEMGYHLNDEDEL